jgi:hypothetical protein
MSFILGKSDKLVGLDRSDWIVPWWNWFYSIEEKDHPSYTSNYGVRSNDYNQGRLPYIWSDDKKGIWSDDKKGKVWFLAGAYGTTSSVRSIIPVGDWEAIVAPAYVMGASKQEFPSLSDAQIQKLVEDDVNGVKPKGKNTDGTPHLQATFDGKDYTSGLERIKWDVCNWFKVTNIPQENILGLDDVDSIDMVSDGIWMFLNMSNIPAGDHKLHLRGEAPNYISDMTFNLTIRGKPKR